MRLDDGYIDLPAGKIANVQTCLEMLSRPPARPDPASVEYSLQRIAQPDTARYRDIFRRIGEPYLWFARLLLSDDELARTMKDPDIEIYTVRYHGNDEGLLELDFRTPRECELLYFGLTDALVGKGTGRWLMNRAIEIAWSHPIDRFWVHTCNLDHPNALGFYIRSGFRPFKRQIEIADDPRLTGALSPDAAPHIPLI
jgi:GNAT superfamily N-acetyltransferase